MLSPQTVEQIESLATEMAAMFLPPEMIVGCEVLSVADKDQYATNNGWIEARVGRHNQQRCRWRGQFTNVQVGDYVDVLYFVSYRLFVVFSRGGGAAIPDVGGWGFDHIWRVSLTNADADYPTIQAAIDAAGTGAGDVILCDSETHNPADTILINKAITLLSIDPYGLTINFSEDNKPAIKITAAGGKVVNLNVIHSGAGTTAAALELAANGAIAENCILTASGAANNGFGIFLSAGTQAEIRNCQAYDTNGTIISAGFYNASGTTAAIYGGLFSGDDADINNVSGATLELLNLPKLVNSRLTNAGTFSGLFQGSSGNVSLPDKVKNTSGGAVTPGQMGYTTWVSGSGLEFKTTTTANDNRIGAVACVIVGGANSADIYVTNTGRHTIPYAGTAPNAGEFLVFSTTGGSVAAQAYMSPDVCAIAMAAGSGGTVDAVLLCGSTPNGTRAALNMYSLSTVSSSDWTGVIQALPGGAAVRYTNVSGSENNLVPGIAATSTFVRMRIYNSTRGTYGLISACNTTGGGGYDGEITLTATADAGWQVGDSLTIRSQKNTDVVSSAYFVDFEIVSGTISDLTREINIRLSVSDTAAGGTLRIHPWQTGASAKRELLVNTAAGQTNMAWIPSFPIIANRFCAHWVATGAGTMSSSFNYSGGNIASE